MYADSDVSLFAKRKEVENSIIRYLRVFLQEAFQCVQFFLLICARVHPDLDLVKTLADFDADAVHDVDVLVLGTDGGKEGALPKLVAFLFLDLDLEAAATGVIDVLPHRLHALFEKVHIAVYMMQGLLVSSFVGLRNWKISQNSLTSEKVTTSRKLDEQVSAFILSTSCTHRVKLLDNLKFDIIIYNRHHLQLTSHSLWKIDIAIYFQAQGRVFLIIINMIANRLTKYFFSNNPRLFIFAGQGTQQKGMLSKISPDIIQKWNQVSKQLLQLDLQQIGTTDKQSLINQTEVTQPLLLFSHYLHFQQAFASTLSPHDYMIGHSLGQFSALVNAKSLSFSEGLKLVHQRGFLMKKHTTTPHAMLIIKYKSDKEGILMNEIKKHEVEIACINSKTSIIAAGKKEKINELSKQLKKHQIVSMNLPVSTAFHCKMLENMKEQFNEILQKTHFQVPFCKILRNYDGKTYHNAKDIRQGLLNQLTNPVLFYDSVKSLDKTIQFHQVGHKKWISKFVDEIRCDM